MHYVKFYLHSAIEILLYGLKYYCNCSIFLSSPTCVLCGQGTEGPLCGTGREWSGRNHIALDCGLQERQGRKLCLFTLFL